jgi:hypothetical protein
VALRATFIRVAEGKVDGLFFVFSGGRWSVVGRRSSVVVVGGQYYFSKKSYAGIFG